MATDESETVPQDAKETPASASSPAPTADSLKELGNAAVKLGKFEESILHYSHAIKLDVDNHILHSNRSLAFLRIKQYYHAMDDADETIRISPTWSKGYFRKAEVLSATQHFRAACENYKKALLLQPHDLTLLGALQRAQIEEMRDRRSDEQLPWLGAGVGIILGAAIIIADYIYTSEPTHPVLMAMATIAIAIVGYAIARALRYYIKCQRDSLLEAPLSLLPEQDKKSDADPAESTGSKSESRTSNRYTKHQARQRYKKGKL